MKQFTLRGFILGVVGLLVITTSSMYVALRMGALPWPTVFVTVLSMAVLSRFKNSSLQEMNVTHTLMSAGAMVSGGLAFTLPGIWILNGSAEIKMLPVFVVTILGAILGTVFSALFRRNLIEEQHLVFPIGNAAYETLKAGVEKGKQAVKLFVSMGFSIVFTIVRDLFGWIPAAFAVYKGGKVYKGEVPPVYFWVSPMAFAIGAVIDKMAALCWLAGGVVSCFVLAPLGFSESFRQNLGIGLMIGTGVGILIKFLVKLFKEKTSFGKIGKKQIIIGVCGAVVMAVLLTLFVEINFIQAFIAVILVGVACLLSGMLTGQSGINPMEIFGILVMLGVGALRTTPVIGLFCVAALTAVACGLSGDVMNDLKSGYLLKTNPKAQIKAEFFGGVIGAVLAVLVLFLMQKTFGAFGTDALPAPQARAVAHMANEFKNTAEFFAGIVLGAVLFLCKVPSATLGLGVYLPMQITLPVGLGAIIGAICKKTKKVSDTDVNLVASGFLGGEGIAGVLIAFYSMLHV